MPPYFVPLLFLPFVVVIVLPILRRRAAHRALLNRPFDDQMADLAASAVEVARTQHSLTLDYAPATIADVEEILAALHDRFRAGALDESEASTHANRWGAYIGQCAKRIHPGLRWERQSSTTGRNSMPLLWPDGAESFPCSWCWRRITAGPEDNVDHKFQILILQRGQPLLAIDPDHPDPPDKPDRCL